jgi:DNA-3-methyladenine glycosylase
LNKLPKDFFISDQVTEIARQLLGKYLFTKFDNQVSSVIITETEAYAGITDRASHAYDGRRTARTEVMFAEGGVAYVYLCYGIHSLFNIVTSTQGNPHAVLIRGVVPETGNEMMLQRIGKTTLSAGVGVGPGKVSKLLGLQVAHTGMSVCGNKIWLEDRGIQPADDEIFCGKRIGVDYAGADAELPYRFIYKKLQKI